MFSPQNKPLQSLFESILRPALHGGLSTPIWSGFHVHPSQTGTFTPAQTNCTRGLKCDSIELNEAGVKALHPSPKNTLFLWGSCLNSQQSKPRWGE